MFNNLLAAIEADLNKLSVKQQQSPHDVMIATQRLQLKQLAMQYVRLENQYRELSKSNSIY